VTGGTIIGNNNPYYPSPGVNSNLGAHGVFETGRERGSSIGNSIQHLNGVRTGVYRDDPERNEGQVLFSFKSSLLRNNNKNSRIEGSPSISGSSPSSASSSFINQRLVVVQNQKHHQQKLLGGIDYESQDKKQEQNGHHCFMQTRMDSHGSSSRTSCNTILG